MYLIINHQLTTNFTFTGSSLCDNRQKPNPERSVMIFRFLRPYFKTIPNSITTKKVKYVTYAIIMMLIEVFDGSAQIYSLAWVQSKTTCQSVSSERNKHAFTTQLWLDLNKTPFKNLPKYQTYNIDLHDIEPSLNLELIKPKKCLVLKHLVEIIMIRPDCCSLHNCTIFS